MTLKGKPKIIKRRREEMIELILVLFELAVSIIVFGAFSVFLIFVSPWLGIPITIFNVALIVFVIVVKLKKFNKNR